MFEICLADELQPVNPLPPVYWNFGGHCLMSGVIFPKIRLILRYSACLGVVRPVLHRPTYCKTLNKDQIMNYSNANNENNMNVKDNKGLDQVPDSPEADLKRLFNPAMVVEDAVPKQTSEQWEVLTQLLDKL
ncbi:hypothetical protein TNCV_1940111 [Trichonephila clavipes]|nr:hypothetical protein TNCV_1940111 [Trichonephila clavipes]